MNDGSLRFAQEETARAFLMEHKGSNSLDWQSINLRDIFFDLINGVFGEIQLSEVDGGGWDYSIKICGEHHKSGSDSFFDIDFTAVGGFTSS